MGGEEAAGGETEVSSASELVGRAAAGVELVKDSPVVEVEPPTGFGFEEGFEGAALVAEASGAVSN